MPRAGGASSELAVTSRRLTGRTSVHDTTAWIRGGGSLEDQAGWLRGVAFADRSHSCLRLGIAGLLAPRPARGQESAESLLAREVLAPWDGQPVDWTDVFAVVSILLVITISCQNLERSRLECGLQKLASLTFAALHPALVTGAAR